MPKERTATVGRAFGLGVVASMIVATSAAAQVTLEFPDLKTGGKVSIAVFSTAAGWSRREQPTWSETQAVDSGLLRLRIDLPPGEYAVMAYHYRNANGRLDTLPVGLPTEPYGFSNNSRGMFGPPPWRAAAFRLTAAGVRQVIRLR